MSSTPEGHPSHKLIRNKFHVSADVERDTAPSVGSAAPRAKRTSADYLYTLSVRQRVAAGNLP